MTKPKVSIGVPCYGPQEAKWWGQFAQHMGELHKTVDLQEILISDSMATDHNRNLIVENFLKLDSEWLFWIDADTIVPIGAIDRMIAVGKTMVSGLYWGKNDPHPAIAYYVYNGAYRPLDKTRHWERGEILPVDACGMGCMLVHRSVYEDIQKQFTPYQEAGGGMILVHKDDISGEVTADIKHATDGKVVNGQRRQRLIPLTLEKPKFPFYSLEHGRTEDLWFFEIAARAGHKPYLDTSVECGHIRPLEFTGANWRDLNGH